MSRYIQSLSNLDLNLSAISTSVTVLCRLFRIFTILLVKEMFLLMASLVTSEGIQGG